MKNFWLFFFLQLLSYGINDACFRFIAMGRVELSVSTAMLCAVISFSLLSLLSRIGEAKSRLSMAGYVLGGGFGTFLGILTSKYITGQ